MRFYRIIRNDTGDVLDTRTGEWRSPTLEAWAECAMDVEIVPVEAPTEAPVDKPKEEKKSALDEAKDDAEPKDENGGSKPPEDGSCRECRQRRPLNRLRLCYACFAILVLMEECKKRGYEWKPGDKHPDFCACEGLGEHAERDRGAWRGN